MEQDNIKPVNGWKAYYAATRAIVNINNEFFNIIRERSLPSMSRFWLNADYVKCVHASGELFSGYGTFLFVFSKSISRVLLYLWNHGKFYFYPNFLEFCFMLVLFFQDSQSKLDHKFFYFGALLE